MDSVTQEYTAMDDSDSCVGNAGKQRHSRTGFSAITAWVWEPNATSQNKRMRLSAVVSAIGVTTLLWFALLLTVQFSLVEMEHSESSSIEKTHEVLTNRTSTVNAGVVPQLGSLEH